MERFLQTSENECNPICKKTSMPEQEASDSQKEIDLLRRKLIVTQNELRQMEKQYEQVQFALTCCEGECQQLRDKENNFINEIAAIKNSRTWKVGRFFAKIVRFFVPSGSKRALMLRLLMTLIKHPGKFFKALTPKKMKKFFKLLRQGNISGIRTLVYANIYGGMVPPPELVVEAPKIKGLSMPNSRKRNFEDYTVLRIPQWKEPQVSIIIPVYNQFDYTYLCVESILENSGNISYEIIIANDCSTDLTTRIEEIMPGIRCVTNEQNLRFLLNCNHAAKYAKGKYVLFLNNDTQVQENWLEPLVTLIESADDIGMVGSKLIYPNGLLQEAGGIVWKDASAWNYGNRQNPALPEYNYVKEVDYISGAAIMLSRTLWEEIGGFDERFAPAYYEDTDLAFTVRSKGYRVMYQPKSVVVHFEGVSNGTDTSTGLKQYQVENNIKFYDKWKDVLATHPENGENVFTARDRSYGKTTVLVIDHYVPMYDKDAGSRMEYQYVKLLAEMGYNVKFIGDNFVPHQPYTSVLEQLGIEVLYGNEYFHNWKQWILDNADQFDVVFTSRPHITVKYIDLLKKYTKARIIYNLCDLHYLREMRQYEVTGDESIRESAEATRIREFELIEKSDRVFSVSADEVKILSEFFPADKTVQCPIFIFDEFVDVLPQRQDTKDLMFVGGFGHTPNVDAMKWFCSDVFPLIQREIPDMKLHIVGSKPPEEIKAFASESIIVEGFVSDEKLLELYQTCRVDVIPLRYGAGVKGKSIEAMYNGIPIVTTSIGIEGLPEIEKCITAYDDAENFAAEVVRVYKNGDGGCAQRCYDYVRAHFSEEYAKEFFSREFVPM